MENLRQILAWHRDVFNEASKIQFGRKTNSLVVLHGLIYKKTRILNPDIPAQVVIKGEQGCLSAYATAKSNRHRLTVPIVKKRLSMRLDKRLYSKVSGNTIRITTSEGRKTFTFENYDKLKELFEQFEFGDPELSEGDGDIYIAFPFKTEPVEKLKQKLVLGVDLGIRIAAATSDGRLIKDSEFNGRKRKLRHLKDELKSKAAKRSKSAKRHLKILRRKERNVNRNQIFLLAKEILKTNADTIALENLKGIKAKKHKFQNKNRISQVPLAELREVLTYKAANRGMTVVLVNPAYTSQTDSLTGKVEGERRGRRFYAKSGLVYDADLNAARNIANRAKLPVSYGNILDGQGVVTRPNVGNQRCKALATGKPPNSFGGM